MSWITEQINANAPTFGVLTFLIGLLAGNWLSIGRDRRKEFNDIAIPNYIKLKKQIDHLKIGHFITGVEDFQILEMHVPWYKSRQFSEITKAYKSSHSGISSYDPETGEATFDLAKIKTLTAWAEKLLPYFKRR